MNRIDPSPPHPEPGWTFSFCCPTFALLSDRVVVVVTFFSEIKEVGFSLDSTPGLRPTLRHFAVTPPGFPPRPPGSIDLASKPPTVPSNRGSAPIWESRFPACIVRGVRKTPHPAPGSVCRLAASLGFVWYSEVSDVGSVGQMADLVEKPCTVPPNRRSPPRDPHDLWGFRGIGHPASTRGPGPARGRTGFAL